MGSDIRFKLLLPNSDVINEKTVIRRSSGTTYNITTEQQLAAFIFSYWRRVAGVRSFKQWADELNDEAECGTCWTCDDALDNMSSMFQLNINDKHVHIYDWYSKHRLIEN